jgi:hypothetical protein
MIRQLLLAFGLASVTVAMHAAGTAYLMLRSQSIWGDETCVGTRLSAVAALTRLVSGLLFLQLAEMAVWAAVFAVTGVFADFETSLYYSVKSFTTVGYGDVLPSHSWRLLGPCEAAVGVLMLGWSTGIIVAAVQRIYNRPQQLDRRNPSTPAE